MRRLMSIAVAVFAVVAAPDTARAQEHAASAASLDAIVAAHATTLESDRAELSAFLARPVVADIAAQAGLDIRTAQTAVAVLDAGDLNLLSSQVGSLDAALAGGDSTVVISTTAIIIALLVLVIILVA